jgi:low affinity Fe/Cu permease
MERIASADMSREVVEFQGLAMRQVGVVILVWTLSGPLFHFSDTWQLTSTYRHD